MPRENPAPCKGCEKRRTMCHAMCREYAEWSDEHNKFVRERNKKSEIDAGLGEIMERRQSWFRSLGYKSGGKSK